MTGEVKLLPCDFCGEVWIKVRSENSACFYSECQQCAARGPEASTQAEAIAAWNTRPTLVTGQLQEDGGASTVGISLEAYARWASRALNRLSGGGSEMFVRVGKEFYADPDIAVQRAQERIDTIRRLTQSQVANGETPTPGLTDDVVKELVEALAGIEPYLDAIVCYASTMDEHEPNRLAVNVRAALAKARTGVTLNG